MKDPPVPHEQRDLLLDSACRLRVPVEISVHQGTEEIRLKSYFLPFKGAPATSPVRIFRPEAELSDRLLAPGVKLRATFLWEGKPYFFLSTVIGPSPNSQEILQIDSPSELVHSTRASRSFFRLQPGPRIQVTFWTLVQEDASPPARNEIRRNGWVADISGGGLSIRMDSETSKKLGIESQIGLFWTLRPGDAPYVMKGIVKNKEILNNPRFTKVGVQFVESANKMEFQTNVNRLLRFVAEQEQLQIRKRNR